MWCQCWRSPHLEFEPGEPRCQCWQFQVHVLLQQFPCTKGDDISNMWILRNVHLVYVIYTLIWDSNLEAMNISVAPFTDIDISVVVFFLQYNKKFYLPNLTVTVLQTNNTSGHPIIGYDIRCVIWGFEPWGQNLTCMKIRNI